MSALIIFNYLTREGFSGRSMIPQMGRPTFYLAISSTAKQHPRGPLVCVELNRYRRTCLSRSINFGLITQDTCLVGIIGLKFSNLKIKNYREDINRQTSVLFCCKLGLYKLGKTGSWVIFIMFVYQDKSFTIIYV